MIRRIGEQSDDGKTTLYDHHHSQHHAGKENTQLPYIQQDHPMPCIALVERAARQSHRPMRHHLRDVHYHDHHLSRE
jgi:hypothetical protein